MTQLEHLASAAKSAARQMAIASRQTKDAALEAIAQAILTHQDDILAANQLDLDNARQDFMRDALLDRLTLTPQRLAEIALGVRQVAALPDPIEAQCTPNGQPGILAEFTRPGGLIIQKKRVPLGLIGIIYEARPNVTVDAAVLCLKAGNAVLLRGGKEAIHCNTTMVAVLQAAMVDAGLPAAAVSLVSDTSRASAQEMMSLVGYLDVLIPRGGAGLIRTVTRDSKVPVIRTGEGVCHIYVDSAADLDMAAAILCNAKATRPSVCNSAECVLVHQDIAKDFYPKAYALLKEQGVTVRGCPKTVALLPQATSATAADFGTEFGDYILAAQVVADVDEAMDFIATHGSGHSEAIVTADATTAQRFLSGVDAAAVYHNASTRFTDGFEFGLGAEIGISTQKLHARGPMGLEELTSYKYVIHGNGQIR